MENLTSLLRSMRATYLLADCTPSVPTPPGLWKPNTSCHFWWKKNFTPLSSISRPLPIFTTSLLRSMHMKRATYLLANCTPTIPTPPGFRKPNTSCTFDEKNQKTPPPFLQFPVPSWFLQIPYFTPPSLFIISNSHPASWYRMTALLGKKTPLIKNRVFSWDGAFCQLGKNVGNLEHWLF